MKSQTGLIATAASVMILGLGGCASPTPDNPFWTDIPAAPPAATERPASPSPDSVEPPPPSDSDAEPPPESFEEGLMLVQQVDVRVLGPAPAAVEVSVMGVLGDACTEFDRVEQARSGDTISLTLRTRRPAGMLCAQVERVYERSVTLEGTFPAGAYRIVANDFETTFSVPAPGAEQPVEGLAFVDDVQALVLESFPPQVSLIVSGWLPDGCTRLAETQQSREGNTIRVTITTTRPAEAFCTQATVPFSHNVRLEGSFPAGSYTAIVNDYEVTFQTN